MTPSTMRALCELGAETVFTPEVAVKTVDRSVVPEEPVVPVDAATFAVEVTVVELSLGCLFRAACWVA